MITEKKIKNLNHYSLISRLIDYPQIGFAEEVKDIQIFLDENYPEIAATLQSFTDLVAEVRIDEIQELHTRSFEVQAITTLDLGYLLFGDDYKRAELLVNLNREHQQTDNDCGTELSDHLPNVLRLLPRLEDEELRDELVKKLICPGLKKMIREFNPGNLKKKNEVYKRHHKTLIDMPNQFGTIYQRPIIVILSIFQQDFGIGKLTDEDSSDFLQSINQEMKIEG